ncbi:MAG: ATP-binding protein [Paludibacter sp.]|nr:ATP-binding protein [Paludibacter sp.]
MQPIQRLIKTRIDKRLTPNKVILLFGARRVGKTILMRQIIDSFTGKSLVLNGEDINTLTLLEQQSIANYRQLLNGIDLLAIDEAQNIPDIGKKLKLIVDEIQNIYVLASGSSSFDLLNRAGEPLVGRSSSFMLFPFSQAELSSIENLLETRENLESRIIYGSYPEVALMTDNEERKEYLREIVNAYLLKDILSVDGLKNSGKMKNLLRLIAFQTGNEVSYDELGRQLGMSKNTVEKYLDLLSKVFVIYRLGTYSTNLRNEVSKTGKWYFYDNGIRNAMIGNFSPLALRQDIGQLWESYLISERIKQNYYLGLNKEFYFWRTYRGKEIDLVEIHDNEIHTFEFKWGNKMTKVPLAFANNYPDATFTVINQNNYLEFIKQSI